ncbi:MAG: tRNA pseudouridine(38-40) synthase TruA [Candidatus Polarisedimenticolia bacterium]
MLNLKLTIEYVGTAYHGWQIQPGVPTVQGTLEDRLAVALRRPVAARGAARTDAGVHALGQVASIQVDEGTDPGRLGRSLNALLPDDVAVRRIEEVPEGFHARHSARGRVYRYRILQGDAVSPFDRAFACHVRGRLDVDAMDEAARRLLGTRDFSSFRAAGDVSESPVKEMRCARVERAPDRDDLVVYTVEASSFLQHMVRALAGTLIEVGRGRRSPDDMEKVLAARDRSVAGPTAPARGLFLVQVLYPDLAPPQGRW